MNMSKTSEFEMQGNETRWNNERSRGSFQNLSPASYSSGRKLERAWKI